MVLIMTARISASRLLLVCVLFLAASMPTVAMEKDLRMRTDAAGLTEIGFCQRPSPNAFGFPGHAFVTFTDAAQTGSRSFRAVGHTTGAGAGPAVTAFTYFGGAAVAGRQAEERFTHMKQACLTIKVDRSVFVAALAAARPTLTLLGIPEAVAASAESYALNGNDCVDFAIRIAQVLRPVGLSVPARTAVDTPASYIQKLLTANR